MNETDDIGVPAMWKTGSDQDAFADEHGREAHLGGAIAAALMSKAEELLAVAPTIEKVDVLAAKLPG